MSNDYDYELERQRRRERMKAEKRKQQQRREMLIRLLPVAVGALVVLILIIVGIVAGVKGIKKSQTKKQKEAELEAARIEEEQRLEQEALEAMAEPTPEPHTVNNMMDIVVPLPVMVEGYEVNASGASAGISEEDVQSQYATLINATSGDVIISRNGSDRMYPASMTKVMTVLVAAEHITDLDDRFTITIEDTDYAYKNDLSSVGFDVDETVKVKDLLYGAIMPSGGDACHAIERYVAGDTESFVQLMNDKVKELGLTHTHFTNSSGIYDDNHYTTPYEMAMIMKAAIENDVARQVMYAHRYTTGITAQHPKGIDLSNLFQRRIEDKYTANEVLGAKTGYVVQSGNCAVSYTVVNGTTYICVTGNAHSAWRAIFDHTFLYNAYAK